MKKSKNTLFADIRSHEIRDWERILSVSQKEYTILDIETTGIHSDITELAAMRVEKGKVTERYHTLVKPRGTMERRVVEMTGITPSLVKNAPSVEEVLPSFIGFLGEENLMRHGHDSDQIVLARNLLALGKPLLANEYIDTNTFARAVIPGEAVERKYSVQVLCAYYQLPCTTFHRALADCEAEKLVFESLVKDKEARTK